MMSKEEFDKLYRQLEWLAYSWWPYVFGGAIGLGIFFLVTLPESGVHVN